MSCPICGSININYQGGAMYCPRCKRVVGEREAPALDGAIDAVLAACAGLALDDPADVEVLRGALLGALRSAFHDDTDYQAVEEERDRLRRLAIALYNAGEFIEYHERDHLEGSFEVCLGCGMVLPPHAENCPVEAARIIADGEAAS